MAHKRVQAKLSSAPDPWRGPPDFTLQLFPGFARPNPRPGRRSQVTGPWSEATHLRATLPAMCGNPRHTGPRRLIASLPAAGATQAGLRRPGALKITASCGREPVAPVTLTANGPAAQTLTPRRTRSARASRSCILHATPLTPLLCSVWRGRSPPTPVARPLHPRGLRL